VAVAVNFRFGDGRRRLAISSHDLFPTRIWQAKVGDRLASAASYISLVEEMRLSQPVPAGRTNRGGWNSTDKSVLEKPEFATLRSLVDEAVASAFLEMGRQDQKYELESWINLHERGGFNFLHVHEGSYLSGCLYLSVPPGSGNLIFRDPRPGVLHGYLKGAVANGYRDMSLRPENGLLVLFPSWLEHFVEPHGSDAPRITIAFNAVAIRM
jgi:uncharacterized protein (TIGR02466 family)